DAGPNRTRPTPAGGKQERGGGGWLAARAVAGSANGATADTSTDVRATARAVVPQAMSLPKASLNICFGFFISVLPFPFAGWRQGWPVCSPRLTTGVRLDARGGKIAESSGAPRRSANDRPAEACWPLVRLAAGTLRRARAAPSGARPVLRWRPRPGRR